ncbi:unnamed protein product [Prunus armeniaca]
MAIEIKTLELRIVAEVKLFGDFCFKLGAFGFAEMESSHSNTPNASNPQTQTDHPKHNLQLKHKIPQVRGLWWEIGGKPQS